PPPAPVIPPHQDQASPAAIGTPDVFDFVKVGSKNSLIHLSAVDFELNSSNASLVPLTSVMIVALPGHGALTLGSNAVLVGQVISLGDLDALRFTPDDGYVGSGSFRWIATCGRGWSTVPANVSLIINDTAHAGEG